MKATVGLAGSRQNAVRGVFINTANANCSIYESGRMVHSCISGSDYYALDYFSLDMIDVPLLAAEGKIRLLDTTQSGERASPAVYDFWVFNWHHVTMAPHLNPASLAKLPGLKFTIVLELEPGDPLKLVPSGVFDGHITLDPTIASTDKIFPFPRPLEGDPRSLAPLSRTVPVIGSFGFGTPGKGFELLVEAVNHEFDQAVVRVNIPSGTYTTFDGIHGQHYAKYIASLCGRIAKPGIDVRFTYEFMSRDTLVEWCADNDLNCFMYTRRQPGLSATTDQAIMSGRPLLTSSNDTFRHIHRYIPPYPVIGLRKAIETTPALVHKMQQDWSRRSFSETFHRMLAGFGLIMPKASAAGTTTTQAHQRPAIVVASRHAPCPGDILDYPVRMADCLSRSGKYNVLRVQCDDLSELEEQALMLQPSATILLDPPALTQEARATFPEIAAGPIITVQDTQRAVMSDTQDSGGIFALWRRPIIPYFTTAVELRDGPPGIWLVGFGAAKSNLAEVVAKIERELPEAEILLEVPNSKRAALETRVAGMRQHSGATDTLRLSLMSLPATGDEVIRNFGQSRLTVFYNDPARTDELENVSSLALTTERAVAFTRAAPFPRYLGGGTHVEDFAIPDIIDQGMAAQIGIYYKFGEWQFFAEIDRLLAHTLTRRPQKPSATKTAPFVGAAGLDRQRRVASLDRLLTFTDERFIRNAYLTLLGRKPDPTGLYYFLSLLHQGMPKAAIVGELLISAEGRACGTDLTGARKAIFAYRLTKLPMIRALLPYAGRRSSARPRSDTWVAITAQDILGLRGEDFVVAAYKAVLGRGPEPEGLRHHLALLDNGKSRRVILGALRLSAEGKVRGAKFSGLTAAVYCYRLSQLPALGPLLHLAGWNNDADDVSRALRSIENKLHRLIETSSPQKTVAQATSGTPSIQSLPRSAPVTLPAPSRSLEKPSGPCVFLLVGLAEDSARPVPRFVSRLCQAVADQGAPVRFVSWHTETKSLQLVIQDELGRLKLARDLSEFTTSYPRDGEPRRPIDLSSCSGNDWLLVPEAVIATLDKPPLVGLNIVIEARRVGLRSAFIFHGAGPLRSAPQTVGATNAHEQYMQILLLADAVIPMSDLAANDLTSFFVQHQKADTIPLIKAIVPPAEASTGAGGDWSDYVRRLRGVLTEAADESRDLATAYYWIDLSMPLGAARGTFALWLARALTKHGISLIPTTWDAARRRLTVATGDWADHWAGAGGPESWAKWIDPGRADGPGWVLKPDGVGGDQLADVAAFARTYGLRTAVILHEATNPRDEAGAADLSPRDRADFEALAGIDKVFAVSGRRFQDFHRFLLSWRGKAHSADHRFKMLPFPNEIPAQARRITIKSSTPGSVRVLVVIPTNYPADLITLLDAAAVAAERSSTPLVFRLSGRPSGITAAYDELLRAKLDYLTELRWEEAPPDHPPGRLFEEADFTVYASMEEGLALPVVTSLWYGVPCLVHCCDTVSSAPQPGLACADMRDASALAEAIQKLAEHEWRRYLTYEAIARPVVTWDEYARAIAVELATDRLTDGLRRVESPGQDDVCTTLMNLRRRPKLSLCISTFDRAGWLEVNLRNIFAQIGSPRADLEILVVDNTSTDRTPEVVGPYLARPDFTYLRNPKNVGMLGNLSVTAQTARGEYIWILGDDDLTRPGAIDRILRIVDKHPGIGLIYMNYGYTSESDPANVTDLAVFLDSYNVLEPAGTDELATVKQLAAKTENFFSAIYSHVYRRDHGMRSYCQDTSGRTFSTMRACIPTTYYVLNYMAEEPAYWIGEPSLVINSNVSWADYGALLELEHLPGAWDLAERMGTDPREIDRRRANRLWLVEMMWRDIFECDKAGNSAYFLASRALMRLKHLPEFDKHVDEFMAVYERAHKIGHRAAILPTSELFAAFRDRTTPMTT